MPRSFAELVMRKVNGLEKRFILSPDPHGRKRRGRVQESLEHGAGLFEVKAVRKSFRRMKGFVVIRILATMTMMMITMVRMMVITNGDGHGENNAEKDDGKDDGNQNDNNDENDGGNDAKTDGDNDIDEDAVDKYVHVDKYVQGHHAASVAAKPDIERGDGVNRQSISNGFCEVLDKEVVDGDMKDIFMVKWNSLG